MEMCIPLRDTKRDTSCENTLDLYFYQLRSEKYMKKSARAPKGVIKL